MSRRSHSSVDPATPAGSRNMRARTQGGPQPSALAAADNFQVEAGIEAEAALHAEHTAHSGEFTTAAGGEQAKQQADVYRADV